MSEPEASKKTVAERIAELERVIKRGATMDPARERAKRLLFQLGTPGCCNCAEIDFTNWPSDLRQACSYCRTVDKVLAFEREAVARGLEELAVEWRSQEDPALMLMAALVECRAEELRRAQ